MRWLSFLSTVLANNLLDEPDDEEEIDKPARIVDILVQSEMDGEVGDEPAITANSFLTFAKKSYGLNPPD